MNPWMLRLIGLLILLFIGLIVLDDWFSPKIPPVLQQDISLEINGESQTITPAPLPPPEMAAQEEEPPPAMTLESLTADDDTPQPVLSNPTAGKSNSRKDTNAAVAANDTAAAPAAAEKAKPRKGGSWIQAGAYTNKENADKLLAQLKKRGWPVDTELTLVNGQNMHRVFVGPLSTADVKTYLGILDKEGISARQVTR